jgi:RNA polymerase sigma factor (sigma-70 family)
VSPSRGARRDDAARDFERDEVGTAPSEVAAFEAAWDAAAAPVEAAARRRVAVETFARHEESLRRTAARYSLCDDDADDALQRTLEILLHKAPSDEAAALTRWTQTVVKHEALAVRAERERLLAGPASAAAKPGREDWISLLPADRDGPAEFAERKEAVERSREALATLKPQELRALSLLAEGYSYKEIGAITGFSSRKVNRAVAEGRERFRRFLVRRDGGARCAELAPLLSAFADDEADAAAVATLREHLHTCAHCRATLRAYRAAPGAAAALLPTLPPVRGSLADRLHDAYAALATRVGGSGSGAADSTLGGLAASGGSRGAGMAALAKVLAVCAGTVGGAAACVATGVVPAPLVDPPEHHAPAPAAKVTHHPRHRIEEEAADAVVEYETETAVEAEAETEAHEEEAAPEHHQEKPASKPGREGGESSTGSTSSAPPPSEAGATEYVEPAPAPEPTETASSRSSSSSSASNAAEASKGTSAGEFGP